MQLRVIMRCDGYSTEGYRVGVAYRSVRVLHRAHFNSSLQHTHVQCVCWCVCVGCLFFKDTEPSPLQDSSSVRQQGGLPGPPPRSP